MLKNLLFTAALLLNSLGFAATDVNLATVADLDAVKGIGPALSGKILDERKKGVFTDWEDLIQRVKGIRTTAAVRLSEHGLTVNGQSFHGTAPR